MPERILNAVQMLDQEITPPRRISQQAPNTRKGTGIDLPTFQTAPTFT